MKIAAGIDGWLICESVKLRLYVRDCKDDETEKYKEEEDGDNDDGNDDDGDEHDDGRGSKKETDDEFITA